MRALPQIPAAERAPGRPVSPTAPSPPPGPSFADLLQQRSQVTHGVLAQPVAPPPPLRADPQPRSGVDPDRDDQAPPEARRATRAAAARAGAKPAQPREKVTPAAPPKPPLPSAAPAEGARGEDRAVHRAVEDAASGAVPGADLRDWLASLKLQQAATADLVLGDPAGATDGPSSLGSGGEGGGGAASASDAGADPRVSDDSPAEGGARFAIAGGVRSAVQAPEWATGTPAERHAAPPDAPNARDAMPTLLAGATGAVPRGFDPGTLAPIGLPTPLYAPDFAQALGAQVSLLARDGVQQAELHLNPAEMGPISVQIEIDGPQARVDFSADAAVTRDIIERGLPELAAALREQGLTLSGGGVFQRAPERREPGEERQAAGRSKRLASATAGAVTPRTAALPVALGLLDLYV